MGLGRKIVLGTALGLFALNGPCLASVVVGCDVKKAPRAGAAEAAVRKPARPVERERAERREPVYHLQAPSRRIILQ